MELFNQAAAQLGERVRRMAPGARLTAAASLLLIVLGGGWLCARGARDGETYLLGGQSFSAAQLRDIEGAFGKAGLGDYTLDAARVRVPRSQQAKYLAALADAGALPRDFGEHLRKAVNGDGSMLSGLFGGARQDAQTKIALESELQLAIQRMKGIESAFVHIAEETSDGFPKTKTVTASIGAQPREGSTIDAATVAAMRALVASAWPGLKSDAVTVVDLSDNRLFEGTTGGQPPSAPKTPDLAAHKKHLELDWQEKVARVLGIAGIRVTAHVELEPDGRQARAVSLWVAVPQAHYRRVWRTRHPESAASAEPDAAALAAIQDAETRKIEAAISGLWGPEAPRVEGALRLAVGTIDPPADDPAEAPQAADLAQAWLVDNWQTVAMGGLVVVGLMIFRASLRSTAVSTASPAVELPATLLTFDDEAPEDRPLVAASPAPYATISPAAALREELIGRIRQHPQSAAGVLRTWIGNAN